MDKEFLDNESALIDKVNKIFENEFFGEEGEEKLGERKRYDEDIISDALSKRIIVFQEETYPFSGEFIYMVCIDEFLFRCIEQAGFYIEQVDKSKLKDTMIYCRETGNHIRFNVGDPLTKYYIHHCLMNEKDKEEGYEWSLEKFLQKSQEEDRGSRYTEVERDWKPNFVVIESPAVHYSEILKKQQEEK